MMAPRGISLTILVLYLVLESSHSQEVFPPLDDATAYVGKLFVYPLEAPDNSLAYIVSNTNDQLWLYYDQKTFSIVGVPPPEAEGNTVVVVTVVGATASLSKEFQVTVVKRCITKIMDDMKCGQRTDAIGILFGESQKPTPEEYVHYFKVTAHKMGANVTDVYMETDHDADGNANSKRQIRIFVPVLCSSDPYPKTAQLKGATMKVQGLSDTLDIHFYAVFAFTPTPAPDIDESSPSVEVVISAPPDVVIVAPSAAQNGEMFSSAYNTNGSAWSDGGWSASQLPTPAVNPVVLASQSPMPAASPVVPASQSPTPTLGPVAPASQVPTQAVSPLASPVAPSASANPSPSPVVTVA